MTENTNSGCLQRDSAEHEGYAKASRSFNRISKSALEAVRAGEGNEKATKGMTAYHAQQAIEKIIKAEIYKVNPGISPRKMYTHKIYVLSLKRVELRYLKELRIMHICTVIGRPQGDMIYIFL